MKRRDFLKLSSLAGASAALPLYPTTKLFAAHDNYTGPLYLMIDAFGGWDPTSLCDPKGGLPINTYPSRSIGTIAGSPIKYAPPPDDYLSGGPLFDASLYSNKLFFEKYANKLLIVNGIDVGTVAHSDGRRHSWSGELGKTNFPNFGAVLANALAPEHDIPFITNGGGYAKTADLVVPARLNTGGIKALFEIAYPNRITPSSGTSTQYFSNQVEALINTNSADRQTRLFNDQRLPRLKKSINALRSSRRVNGHLSDLAENLSDTTTVPVKDQAGYFNGRKLASDLYQQGRIALAAYQTGVTATALLSIGNFDTHSRHDIKHQPLLMDFLQGVDGILEEAKDRGLSDRIVIIIGSDFGRTNKYNAKSGKDHWPITSMMFMGNSQQIIRGNRVVGATTASHKALKVDPTSLAVDSNNTNANSVKITPAHIHRELRKLAGIDQSTAATKFSLGGVDLPNLF